MRPPYTPTRRTRASMRPRHKAAENGDKVPENIGGIRFASMRPRHKAAENETWCRRATATATRFNEAAA